MLVRTARPWRDSSRARVATAAVSAGLMLAVGSIVAPVASALPGAPTRDIQQVQNQVRDLEMRAESATERYNNARDQLAQVQSELSALKERSSRESQQLNQILSSVDDLARSAYTSGGVDTSLQVLLADNPSEFLAQAAALDQVAQAQSAAIRRTQTARVRLAQSQAAIKDKEDLAQAKRNEMASAKADADKQLADAKALLSSLQAAERRRLAELAAQQRQQSQQAARAAAAALPRGTSSSSSGSRNTGSIGSAAGGGFAGGGRGALAVQYALGQVGDSYVAAAAGPNAFDCSGLTLAAWRQAGVSLPHYSYSQYSSTRHIPLSEAQPGDLLFFFGGGTHHVAMYIGGGRMVHAANPSSGVIISSVNEPWYQQRFSGVGRVVG